MAKIGEDLTVSGKLTCETFEATTASIVNAHVDANAAIARSKLAQDTLQPYTLDMGDVRVHDAITSFLPASAAADDLGYDGDTFGTGSPHITAGDLKAAGLTTRYGRFQVVLPAEYDDAETVNIRFHCGMQTTVADNTCTIDLQAYESDEEVGISADLCATGATDMNSLTFADKDFTITATGLVSGSVLDCRVAIACNDAATGTAVEPTIGAIKLLCDVKG